MCKAAAAAAERLMRAKALLRTVASLAAGRVDGRAGSVFEGEEAGLKDSVRAGGEVGLNGSVCD